MSLIPIEKEGRQCWGKRRRSLIDLRKRLILKILPINGMSADTFSSRTKNASRFVSLEIGVRLNTKGFYKNDNNLGQNIFFAHNFYFIMYQLLPVAPPCMSGRYLQLPRQVTIFRVNTEIIPTTFTSIILEQISLILVVYICMSVFFYKGFVKKLLPKRFT